jgi:hypothetical protein
MREMKNAYRRFMKKNGRKASPGKPRLLVFESITLKWTSKKEDEMAWTGFIWLNMWRSDGLL